MFSVQLVPRPESRPSRDQNSRPVTPQRVVEGKADANETDLNEAIEQQTDVNECESVAENAQGRAVDNDYDETPRDQAQSEQDQDSVRAKNGVGDERQGDFVQIA